MAAKAHRRGRRDATLRSLLRERPREVLAALERDGVITARERPGLVDQRTGQLSGEGKQLAERAILGAVVPDGKTLLMAPPAETNKVAGALAPLATARAEGGDWDLTPALDAALRLRARMAAEGLSADDVLAQRDLLGEKQADARTEALTRALGRTARRFRGAAQEFAQLARRARGGQGDMFGAPTSAEEAFQASFGAKGASAPSVARHWRRQEARASDLIAPGEVARIEIAAPGDPPYVWVGPEGREALARLNRLADEIGASGEGEPPDDGTPGGLTLNSRAVEKILSALGGRLSQLDAADLALARAVSEAARAGDGTVMVGEAADDPKENELIRREEMVHHAMGVLDQGDPYGLLSRRQAVALLSRLPQPTRKGLELVYGPSRTVPPRAWSLATSMTSALKQMPARS